MLGSKLCAQQVDLISKLKCLGCNFPGVLLLQVETYALHVLHTLSKIRTCNFR